MENHNYFTKRFALRKPVKTSMYFETGIPTPSVEQFARVMDLSIDEVLENYEMEARYGGDIVGVEYRFVEKEGYGEEVTETAEAKK